MQYDKTKGLLYGTKLVNPVVEIRKMYFRFCNPAEFSRRKRCFECKASYVTQLNDQLYQNIGL